MFQNKHKEKGSVVIENIIVLPIVFVIVFSIIILLFIMYEKTALESAVEKGLIYGAKMISDPLNKSITNKGESFNFASLTDKKNYRDIEPYRYLFISNDKMESLIETYIRDYLKKSSLDSDEDIDAMDIVADVENKITYIKISVEAKKKYPLPDSIIGIKFGPLIINSKSTTIINDTDEFIRNIDLAYEILEDCNIFGEDSTVEKLFDKVEEFIKRFFKDEGE